jgi:hypothetical protein
MFHNMNSNSSDTFQTISKQAAAKKRRPTKPDDADSSLSQDSGILIRHEYQQQQQSVGSNSGSGLLKPDYMESLGKSNVRNNSSPVKINELLMMNQSYNNEMSRITATTTTTTSTSYQPSSSNFYLLQSPPGSHHTTTVITPTLTQTLLQSTTPSKMICKDDNLKKMLSSLSQDDDDHNQLDLCLKKNILGSKQSGTSGGSYLPQLDGAADEMDEKPATVTTSTSNKLANTKVVINHELLNSYGITLNPTTNETKYTKPYYADYQQTQQQPIQQQQQIGHHTPHSMPKSNLIKNLISQKHEMDVDEFSNNHNTAPAGYHHQQQQQQQHQIQLVPPKVNGDNTLLKALLQTAPKNAATASSSIVPAAAVTVSTAAPASAAVALPTLVPVLQPPILNSRQKGGTASGSRKHQQNKLMNDLKNKIIESSAAAAAATTVNEHSQVTIPQTASPTTAVVLSSPNRMKINTILENTKKRRSESEKSSHHETTTTTTTTTNLGPPALRALHPPVQSMSIQYAEKEHIEVIKSTFNLEMCGSLFRLSVQLRDVDDTFLHVALDDVQQRMESEMRNKKKLKRKIQQTFRLCSSRLTRPPNEEPHSLAMMSLVDDSEKRLNDSLDNEKMDEDEAETTRFDEEQSLNDTIEEYFRKTVQECGAYLNVPSPAIELVEESSSLVVVKSETKTTSAAVDSKHPVIFKLSKKASAHLKLTISRLSELLSIEIPDQVDLGKCVIKSELDEEVRTKAAKADAATSSAAAAAGSETAFSLQSLANQFNLCRFCESLIDLNENKENGLGCIQFCSDFCKVSYKRILLIKKSKKNLKVTQSPSSLRFQLEEPVTAATAAATSLMSPNEELKARKRALENSKLIFKWNANQANQLINRNRCSDERRLMRFENVRLPSANDKRVCIFCQLCGDHDSNGCSRLLSIDVDKWCHLNCALWSDEVYETMNGALVNVDSAYKKASNALCGYCHQKGASLKCFIPKCNATYHLPCAIKDKCAFNQDKVGALFLNPFKSG